MLKCSKLFLFLLLLSFSMTSFAGNMTMLEWAFPLKHTLRNPGIKVSPEFKAFAIKKAQDENRGDILNLFPKKLSDAKTKERQKVLDFYSDCKKEYKKLEKRGALPNLGVQKEVQKPVPQVVSTPVVYPDVTIYYIQQDAYISQIMNARLPNAQDLQFFESKAISVDKKRRNEIDLNNFHYNYKTDVIQNQKVIGSKYYVMLAPVVQAQPQIKVTQAPIQAPAQVQVQKSNPTPPSYQEAISRNSLPNTQNIQKPAAPVFQRRKPVPPLPQAASKSFFSNEISDSARKVIDALDAKHPSRENGLTYTAFMFRKYGPLLNLDESSFRKKYAYDLFGQDGDLYIEDYVGTKEGNDIMRDVERTLRNLIAKDYPHINLQEIPLEKDNQSLETIQNKQFSLPIADGVSKYDRDAMHSVYGEEGLVDDSGLPFDVLLEIEKYMKETSSSNARSKIQEQENKMRLIAKELEPYTGMEPEDLGKLNKDFLVQLGLKINSLKACEVIIKRIKIRFDLE